MSTSTLAPSVLFGILIGLNGCMAHNAATEPSKSQPVSKKELAPGSSNSSENQAPPNQGTQRAKPPDIGIDAEQAAIARPLGPIDPQFSERADKAPFDSKITSCESKILRDPANIVIEHEKLGHAITIAPGEILCIEFESRGSALIPTKLVSSTKNPDKTIVFEAKADKNGTMLSVISPFARPVRYHGLLVLGDNIARTSFCTVLPAAFEMWGEQVDGLFLHNFTQNSEGDDRRCRK